MPVQLLPQEQVPVQRPKTEADDLQESIIPVIASVFWSVLICGAIGSVVLLGGMKWLKPAMIAAEKLRQAGGGEKDFWEATWMPTLLLTFFGGVYGAFTRWWISWRISLSHRAAWIVDGAAVGLLLIAGVFWACRLFPKTVPNNCWIGLFCMTLASLLGIYLASRWEN